MSAVHVSKNFLYRLLFGTLFAGLTGSLVFFSQYETGFLLFVLGMIAIQMVALSEFLALCEAKGFSPATRLLYVTSVLIVASHACAVEVPSLWWVSPVVLLTGTLLSPAFTKPISMANLALTLFGTMYISLPFSWLLDIAGKPHTTFWITWLFLTTKGSDVAAYFCGKFFGRHPLAPQLSPKKTVEGALGGLFGASLLSVVLALIWNEPPQLSTLTLAFIGAITGATAMGGDLFESLLKRDAGVKDSNSIPGLGGILDTIDSLLFTTPLLYIILRMMGYL